MKIDVRKFDFIKNFSVKELFAAKKVNSEDDTEKLLFTAMGLLFALLMAIVLCSFCATLLNHIALRASLDLARGVSTRTASASADVDDKDAFTQANIFGSVIRSSGDGEGSSSADSLLLRGTLPHIGAWISSGGEAKLLLLRQQIAGWTLEDVSYGKVLLSKDGESAALYMSYANGSSHTTGSGKKSSGKNEKIDFSAVRKAEKGKEGFMPREVVDKLLMNPYDEVGKMKMVPADGGGMKLERIDSSCVLGLAGVQQGDVIKAVNGVHISNLGDLTNAINSMLSGSRFDVTVQRGNENLDLKYAVN